ncbi:MAG: phosphopantothenoylcysteine decarboxylase [Candidatus Omnitrophica bacterium]|nr:phosphopantothenoylcysteine decarboxylase [Candidatus Omnitrophota bacterium]
MDLNRPLKNKKILITCGPTWVPIDQMRVISNASTGEIGHRISHLLSREGANTTLVQGPVTHPLRHMPNRILNFRFFDELSRILLSELKKTSYDVVIHAAAVSDYKLRKPYTKKINSNLSEFKLDLVPTQKLIQKIKKISPKTFLVGFKLESDAKKEFLIARSETLIQKAKCNLVVVNVASQKSYTSFIVDEKGDVLSNQHSKEHMAKDLIEHIRKKL